MVAVSMKTEVRILKVSSSVQAKTEQLSDSDDEATIINIDNSNTKTRLQSEEKPKISTCENNATTVSLPKLSYDKH